MWHWDGMHNVMKVWSSWDDESKFGISDSVIMEKFKNMLEIYVGINTWNNKAYCMRIMLIQYAFVLIPWYLN